ncbi:hypothetical protein [Cytobacillus gottheilii]|uniref:hypothetical protein n=1 Tax=Cytobacillus gottheilii TaxID=859144 RepID=UPI00111B4A9D|nr:hypothetical protein [Cytobacillus gottheilii]
MNMHMYYKQKAVIALNAGIAALIPPVYFIVYGLIDPLHRYFVWLLCPFLVYSFICYQVFVINKKRCEETKSVMEEAAVSLEQDVTSIEKLLITFLPSPNLHMQLYDHNGYMAGELRDINQKAVRWFMPYFAERLLTKKYGLYDHSGRLNSTILIKKNTIELIGMKENAVLHFKSKRGKGFIEFLDYKRSKSYYLEKSLFRMDAKIFINSSAESAVLQKGYLPLSYQSFFKDANTPLLTFHKELDHMEKLSVLAIIADYLSTLDH